MNTNDVFNKQELVVDLSDPYELYWSIDEKELKTLKIGELFCYDVVSDKTISNYLDEIIFNMGNDKQPLPFQLHFNSPDYDDMLTEYSKIICSFLSELINSNDKLVKKIISTDPSQFKCDFQCCIVIGKDRMLVNWTKSVFQKANLIIQVQKITEHKFTTIDLIKALILICDHIHSVIKDSEKENAIYEAVDYAELKGKMTMSEFFDYLFEIRRSSEGRKRIPSESYKQEMKEKTRSILKDITNINRSPNTNKQELNKNKYPPKNEVL